MTLALAGSARAAPTTQQPRPLGQAPALIGGGAGKVLIDVADGASRIIDVASGRRGSLPVPPQRRCLPLSVTSTAEILLECQPPQTQDAEYYLQGLRTGALRRLGVDGDDLTFGVAGRYWAVATYCSGPCAPLLVNLNTGVGYPQDSFQDTDLDQPDADARWCAKRGRADYASGKTVVRQSRGGLVLLTCGRPARFLKCHACTAEDFDGRRVLAVAPNRLVEFRLRKSGRVVRRSWRLDGLRVTGGGTAVLAGRFAVAAVPEGGSVVRLFAVSAD